MRISKSGTSIIEVMVVLLVMTVSIVGAFKIFTTSTKLSLSTKNRIQAIQIAREGIEGFTNLRDTNWILYSADYKNCWNVIDYDQACIGNFGGERVKDGSSYIIYPESDNRWYMDEEATGNYSDSDYRDRFRVYLDDTNSLYTQNSVSGTELSPVYTRELIFNYIDTDGDGTPDSDDEKIRITSLVQWSDSSTSRAYKVELETIVSNRRNRD